MKEDLHLTVKTRRTESIEVDVQYFLERIHLFSVVLDAESDEGHKRVPRWVLDEILDVDICEV